MVNVKLLLSTSPVTHGNKTKKKHQCQYQRITDNSTKIQQLKGLQTNDFDLHFTKCCLTSQQSHSSLLSINKSI